MSEEETGRKLRVCVLGRDSVVEAVPAEISGRIVETLCCADDQELVQSIADAVPDVVLMDARYATGLDSLLDRIIRRHHDLPVIVVGPDPSVDTVIECIRKRARDFIPTDELPAKLPQRLLKAADDHRLLVKVNQLIEVYDKGQGKLGAMVGVSPAMNDVYDTIKNISGTDATVFISGPSGVGKEVVAEAIHALSHRSDGRFVPVNCAAIPKDLLESELFGHEKGAFTGADQQRVGNCEQADRGTLFLDEICEMQIGLQSKLLRFLQNHIFTRVGGTEQIEVDTRVIAATNKDPRQQVQDGTLRDDLYYRLNVVPIYIPPLKERPEDIPVLAEHFLRMMCEKYYKYFYDFSPEAIRMLLAYDWPGNVRELRNIIERIVVLATTDRVTAELLPVHIREALEGKEVPQLAVEQALEKIGDALQSPQPRAEDQGDVIPFAEVEKRAILGGIRKCDGDISKAARKLCLSRATLYRKLEKYGLR